MFVSHFLRLAQPISYRCFIIDFTGVFKFCICQIDWCVPYLSVRVHIMCHVYGYEEFLIWEDHFLNCSIFFLLIMSISQVLGVLKTRQVSYLVLNRLIEYVQNLERSGLLEEKEMLHLHDGVQVASIVYTYLSSVVFILFTVLWIVNGYIYIYIYIFQTDLKRLHRNRPLVVSEISMHPMLGALPSSVRETLAKNTKEMMKLCGVTLYKEGSKSRGIWLISSGVVKVRNLFSAIPSVIYNIWWYILKLEHWTMLFWQWESRIIRNKRSFYPTFTHGSSLGLYEVLTGRPYICTVTTDSVVLCLFLEADKIISCLKSEPSVEDFLWQVCYGYC